MRAPVVYQLPKLQYLAPALVPVIAKWLWALRHDAKTEDNHGVGALARQSHRHVTSASYGVFMGHIILLNGVPAAGKSSVAAKLRILRPRLQVVDGDAVIRATKRAADPIAFAERTLERVLNTDERKALRGPVALDQAMPPNYLLQARTRFAGSCTTVLLTIDDEVRVARQEVREAQGRRLTYAWDPGWTAFGQAAYLRDLVLDANGPDRGGLDADDCAGAILEYVGSVI